MPDRLSYSQLRQAIFDYFADHFKHTGTTDSLTLEELAAIFKEKPVRVQRAVDKMIDEDTLEQDPLEEEVRYKLTGFAYSSLVLALRRVGKLPPPPPDAGPDFKWVDGENLDAIADSIIEMGLEGWHIIGEDEDEPKE